MHALRVRQHVLQRDHPAHRVTEKMHRREIAIVDERGEVGRQLIEGVSARVAGVRAVAVPALVVGHDPPRLRELVEDVDEVQRRTGEAVHQQERRIAAARFVVSENDIAGLDLLTVGVGDRHGARR